jgi:hypothetical protein
MNFPLPNDFSGRSMDLRGFTRATLEAGVGSWLLKARCCVCGTDFVGMRGVGTHDGNTWAHCACLLALWADANEESETYDATRDL